MYFDLNEEQLKLLIEAIEQYYYMCGYQSEELDSLYLQLKKKKKGGGYPKSTFAFACFDMMLHW